METSSNRLHEAVKNLKNLKENQDKKQLAILLCLYVFLFIIFLIGLILLGVGSNCNATQNFQSCSNSFGSSIAMIIFGILMMIFSFLACFGKIVIKIPCSCCGVQIV